MPVIDYTLRRRSVFTKQVAIARKKALNGCLGYTELQALSTLGKSLGLSKIAVDEIIALSAETWRGQGKMQGKISNTGFAARR